MNRYHQNHPDPEIREKFSSWQEANANYLSRSRGFSSHEAELAYKNKKAAAKARNTVLNQLKAIGAAVAHNLRNPAAANQAKKMRRASGRRGS